MTELRLWEVMPRLSCRADMGRVVVHKNEEGQVRRRQVAGRIIWCCSRAFLTEESFQNHKRSAGCSNNTIAEASDSEDDDVMMVSQSSDNHVQNGGFHQTPQGNSRAKAKRTGLSLSPPKAQMNVNSPLQSPYRGNSKWIVSGRKVSNLLKTNYDGSPSPSDASYQRGEPTPNKTVVKKEKRASSSTSASPSASAFNVMTMINLKPSDDGTILLSCKMCDFTSGETSIISEHIKKNHWEPPEEKPIKVEIPPVDDSNCHSENRGSNSGRSVPDKKVLTCNLCNLYTSSFSHNLELHKTTAHGPNNPFPCSFCTCAYPTKTGLSLHINRYHKNGSSTGNPSETDKASSRGSSRPPTQTPVSCDLCSFTGFSMSDIEIHKLSDHVPNGRFRCTNCSCAYSTLTAATIHFNKVHCNDINVPNPPTKKVGRPVGRPSSKSISVEKWVEQTLEQAEGDSDEEMEVVSDPSIKQEISSPTKERLQPTMAGPFKCSLCPRKFGRKYHLLAHSRTAHRKGNTSVKNVSIKGEISSTQDRRCQPCQLTFTTAYHLAIHNTTCHVPGGAFPCPTKDCKCVMDSSNSLKNHLRKCQLRTITAVSQVDMNQAESKVEKIDPSSTTCDLCGFAANSNTELNTHLKDSHVICGVECICGCTFGTATELTNHKNNECQKSLESLQIMNVVSMASSDMDTSLDTSKDTSLLVPDSSPDIVRVTCPCGKGFRSRSELVKHKRNCDYEKDKKEEEMKMEATEASLEDQEPPPSEPEVRCPQCDKFFKNEKGLLCHINLIHENNVFYDNCTICGYHTPTYMVHKSHKKSCHVKDGIPCPECPTTFRTFEGLNQHFYMSHKSKLDKASLELRCSECSYVTFRPTEMEKHKSAGHIPKPIKPPKEKKAFKCDFCPYEGGSSAVEYHMKTNHVQNGFKCKMCTSSFATKQGRRTHLAHIHQSGDLDLEDDTPLHQCQLCEYSTSNSTEFEKHSTKNHVVEGFTCTYCNNSFASEAGLRGHIQNRHERKEVDFSKCGLCGYTTGTRKNYKNHMRTNHIENGFLCPHCPCTMRDVHSLYQHSWMLHKIKINKDDFKLSCEHCDYKTGYPINLKQHLKSTHSATTPQRRAEDDIPCKLCGAKMASSAMEDHISRAHVEGGHPCPHCKCSFANQLGVRIHAKVKHGETLVFPKEWDTNIYVEACTECDVRFKTRTGLSQHYLKKHGITIELPKTVKIKIPTKRTCGLCHAQFTETLAGHQKRYHVENGFKCSHCICTFETFESRTRHMVKAHKINLVKSCNICGNKFLGTIKKHMSRYHVENGFKCSHSHCCYTFETFESRTRHMIKAHNITLARSCNICGNKFLGTIKKHISKCHVTNGIPCDFCCCTFESMPGKHIHERKIHNSSRPKQARTCDLCRFTISGPLEDHIKRCHVPGGVPCNYCPSTFQTEIGKVQHLKIRHKVKVSLTPKVCNLCGILPSVPMRYHLQQSHVPEGGVQCSFCSCSFRSDLSRSRHLERYHDVKASKVLVKRSEVRGEVKASVKSCNLCGITLQQPLKLHLRKHHVKNSIYKCSMCTCSYGTATGRRLHLWTVHNQKDDPAMKGARHCRLCGELINGPMGEHMTHSHLHTNPHKCTQCVCRFKTSTDLEQHISSSHNVSTAPPVASIPAVDLDSKSPAMEEEVSEPDEPAIISEPDEPEAINEPDEPMAISEPDEAISEPDEPAIINEPTYIAKATPTIREKGVLKCSFCPRKFPTQTGLKIHVRHIHSSSLARERVVRRATVEKSPDSSDVSDSGSDQEEVTNMHKKIAAAVTRLVQHPKEKLTCAKCGYLATSPSLLNIHLQKSHVKGSPFPCTKCTCGFASAGELARHRKVLHP